MSDGNNITHSKPDPEVFTMAAQMLNLPADQCLVVEDALAGVEAAAAGGFHSAGIGPAAKSGLATYPLNTFSDPAEAVIPSGSAPICGKPRIGALFVFICFDTIS